LQSFSFFGDNNIEIKTNENMSKHTTFKIGGNADVFALPKDIKELKMILDFGAKNGIPTFVLGNGSNILVSDNGIEGIVISTSKLDEISVNGDTVTCMCGAVLSAVCNVALKNNLTGLEFAFGIPGSVGGGLYMNAGAYGGDMSQVVKGAYCLDFSGKEYYFTREEMELSYRNSIFSREKYIITKIEFALSKGNYEEIHAKMQELMGKRKEKQPLEYPSAGSTFKRPEGNFAGTLIEKSGLKGFSVGGAEVSRKHAGFVINKGNATQRDVSCLIEKVKEKVYLDSGVVLEPEVIFVGRENL